MDAFMEQPELARPGRPWNRNTSRPWHWISNNDWRDHSGLAHDYKELSYAVAVFEAFDNAQIPVSNRAPLREIDTPSPPAIS